MGEPEAQEQAPKPQDKAPTEALKASEETQVNKDEAATPSTEPEAIAPKSIEVKKDADKDVASEKKKEEREEKKETKEKETKEPEAEASSDSNNEDTGANEQKAAREGSIKPNVTRESDDTSVDDITQAISNVSLHHSSYHRYDDGTVEVGAGFTVPGQYVSKKGYVHDTSKPPPQPCFNCQGNHWRKDCPWGLEYSR